MKRLLIISLQFMDLILFPLTILSTFWLKLIRRIGINRMIISKSIFNKIGLLPIHDHYYEPLINPKKHLSKKYEEDRNIHGLNLNVETQIKLLSSFDYENELINFSLSKENEIDFFYNNKSFEMGDSEFLYSIIRKLKPQSIIEIGSGHSTRMVLNAIQKNKDNNKDYNCELSCIEPYEYKLIEKLPVNILKKKIEDVEISYFNKLQKNDILFIDSSHIIRPEGDVLYEIQNILPSLNSGVIIHIHDIFTPKNYPKYWINNHVLWNEQYLVEAFLMYNTDFEIIGSLNYLKNNNWDLISSKFPILKKYKDSQPGSLWIRKL